MHNKFGRFTPKKVQETSWFCPSLLWGKYHIKAVLSTLHFPNCIAVPSFSQTGFCSNATQDLDAASRKTRASHYRICTWVFIFHADIVRDYRLPRHPCSVVSDSVPLAPGNRSEIITLAQHCVSVDGWDGRVILTFQLIAEHLFSHVGESASEIMYQILVKTLGNTISRFVCRLWFQSTDGVSCWPFGYFDIDSNVYLRG